MNATPAMPAVFLGHGSPMNALQPNRHTGAWRAIGAALPPPRAILMVSAHWYINATAVTAMAQPRTIHDFYGFPPELYQVRYPAPGLPELADEIADAIQPDALGRDTDSWGLDHGAWSVLLHAFPRADIPVVQLSINALKPLQYHVDLGARLAALRDRGVLLIGSGNLVHNLRLMDWQQPDAGFGWARAFNEHAIGLLATRPADAASLASHADFARAVPSPDHFLPLLYVAGFAAATGVPLQVLSDGYAYGSLSMTCFGAGIGPVATQVAGAGGAPAAPALPPEQSNV